MPPFLLLWQGGRFFAQKRTYKNVPTRPGCMLADTWEAVLGGVYVPI